MGLFSGLCNFVSGAFSAACSAVRSIGSAVGSFCANVLPRIEPFVALAPSLLGVVGRIAQAVSGAFGIFKPQETTEEIGERALQAADRGIRLDGGESFEAYMEKIRNLKLDAQISERRAPEEKTVAGLAVGARGLEDKFGAPEGSMGHLWVLAAARPDFFTAERLTGLIQATKDVAGVFRYFDGALSPEKALAVEKTLVDFERKASPEKSEAEIFRDLDAVAAALRNSPSN